jgi:hypothetical protein
MYSGTEKSICNNLSKSGIVLKRKGIVIKLESLKIWKVQRIEQNCFQFLKIFAVQIKIKLEFCWLQ